MAHSQLGSPFGGEFAVEDDDFALRRVGLCVFVEQLLHQSIPGVDVDGSNDVSCLKLVREATVDHEVFTDGISKLSSDQCSQRLGRDGLEILVLTGDQGQRVTRAEVADQVRLRI